MKGDDKELVGKPLLKRVMQKWLTTDAVLEMIVDALRLSLAQHYRYWTNLRRTSGR
jgi:hypothetical protein